VIQGSGAACKSRRRRRDSSTLDLVGEPRDRDWQTAGMTVSGIRRDRERVRVTRQQEEGAWRQIAVRDPGRAPRQPPTSGARADTKEADRCIPTLAATDPHSAAEGSGSDSRSRAAKPRTDIAAPDRHRTGSVVELTTANSSAVWSARQTARCVIVGSWSRQMVPAASRGNPSRRRIVSSRGPDPTTAAPAHLAGTSSAEAWPE